jgi:hypothetical protein
MQDALNRPSTRSWALNGSVFKEAETGGLRPAVAYGGRASSMGEVHVALVTSARPHARLELIVQPGGA